jgi:tRNA pseudouridine(38-40) synthase
MPADLPKGGMFKSNGRNSLSRRKTFLRAPTPEPKGNVAPVKQKKGLFSCFKKLFVSKGEKMQNGSERLKQSLNATLARKAKKAEPEENFSSTLRRSVSQKRKLQDVIAQDISEREELSETLMFAPLAIPEPTSEEKERIKEFRMSHKQYQYLQAALALFNGTHNFHNYIGGSVQNDSRCFVHVFNIEASPVEIHQNMEWIRIKIQAQSFARDQIRKMMGTILLM